MTKRVHPKGAARSAPRAPLETTARGDLRTFGWPDRQKKMLFHDPLFVSRFTFPVSRRDRAVSPAIVKRETSNLKRVALLPSQGTAGPTGGVQRANARFAYFSPQPPPLPQALAGAPQGACAGPEPRLTVARAEKVESICSNCRPWQAGHSGWFEPITRASKVRPQSLQRYSKIGIGSRKSISGWRSAPAGNVS